MDASPYLPTPGYAHWRKLKSTGVTAVLVVCALAVIAPLFLIIYFLLARGFGSIDWNFFTQLPKPTGEIGDSVRIGITKAAVADYVFSPAYTVPVGVWTHLAFVGASHTVSLYTNGVLEGTVAVTNFMLPRGVHWRDALPVNANGKLDRTGLYRELSALADKPGA